MSQLDNDMERSGGGSSPGSRPLLAGKWLPDEKFEIKTPKLRGGSSPKVDTP